MPPMVGPYMQSEIDELRAENKRLKEEEHTSQLHLERMTRSRDELRARIAESEGQEPIGFVDSLGLYLFRTAPNNDMISFRTKPAKGDVGVYLAAGAKGEMK